MSNPARNDCRMTVQDRIDPEPSTGVNSYAGSVDPQWGQTASGGWLSSPHRAQRANARKWEAVAVQNPS